MVRLNFASSHSFQSTQIATCGGFGCDDRFLSTISIELANVDISVHSTAASEVFELHLHGIRNCDQSLRSRFLFASIGSHNWSVVPWLRETEKPQAVN